jgi:hypothetical protein
MLCRLLDLDSISHNQVLQTALAHAFCLLIGSLEDINSSVAQRAVQYLETIKTSSIKVSLQCRPYLVLIFSSIFIKLCTYYTK